MCVWDLNGTKFICDSFAWIIGDAQYYKEFSVPTPGPVDRGKARIVTGAEGEIYFTPDHYESFVREK